MRRVLSVLIVAATFGSVIAAQSASLIYQLPIGDPARRDREVPVVLDGIVDTAMGDTITPDVLATRLAATRLLLVGETHTGAEFHRVQFRVIRALQEAGRRVLVGLEMFPYTEQASLDRWNTGEQSERDFVESSKWYEHWGYHWNYYRDIFLFARDHWIPIFALNTPREVITAVRRKGLGALSPEEAARIPPRIDVDSADHLTFFKASFEEGDALHGGMSEEAWKGMLAAQATWDATMGYNAVKRLQADPDRNVIMVVLVGSGHVAYGVGIERQARQWFDGGIASVIPVPVRDEKGAEIPRVRATYANFVWGVEAETETAFPTLGLSTRAVEGSTQRQVIQVEKNSAAAAGGFEVGDTLISMDGQALANREVLNRLMAGKTWGDAAAFVVKRGEREVPLTLVFRRSPKSSSSK